MSGILNPTSFVIEPKIIEDVRVLKAYLAKNNLLSRIIKENKNIKNHIIINNNDECYDLYDDYGDKLDANITFIPKNEDFKDLLEGDAVLLEDCFTKAKRNIDYINKPDETFSRNHTVYQKRGYKGFSDYSIVGDSFEESGFAPLAIAIHIVYFGKKDALYVHHFVSESNENISDPARKFEEAMNNLVNWENYENLTKTYGLNVLLDYFYKGRFPGLGVIKKCSIMHHMEVIGKYLEEQK